MTTIVHNGSDIGAPLRAYVRAVRQEDPAVDVFSARAIFDAGIATR